MPLSVNWTSKIITIPKNELTLITGTRYKITVAYYWQLLRESNESEEGIVFDTMYNSTAATSSTPQIVDIINGYTVQFEDGLYSVEFVNGNTNFREVEIKNQVSVGTNNTTGFIDPTFLEAGLFEGHVAVDVINGFSGTGYTSSGGVIGTKSTPSNNIPDAIAIAGVRGLDTLYIQGDITLGSGDNVSGFKILGQNAARTTITINDASNTLETEIQEATVTGSLDGNTIIRYCTVSDLNFFSGFLYESQINGTISLGANAQADILGCYSGVPGQQTPTIDFGGSGQSLSLRKYSGGIKLINKTGADSASIDLIGGQVQIDLVTVTNGTIVVRGTGKVVDAANTEDWLPHGTYGSLSLDNETTYGRMTADLWTVNALDPDVPVTVTKTSRIAGDVDQTISGDGINTTTIQRN